MGVKLFTSVGGLMTITVAAALLPVPPFVEVTLPDRLSCCPSAVPVTVTLNWQLPPAAIEAPESAIVRVAAVATRLLVPPQTLVVALATDKPAGRTSVTATPVKAVVGFGLVMVKLKLVVPPTEINGAPNVLVIEGG